MNEYQRNSKLGNRGGGKSRAFWMDGVKMSLIGKGSMEEVVMDRDLWRQKFGMG